MGIIKQEFELMFLRQSKRLNIIRYFSYQAFSWFVLLFPTLFYMTVFVEKNTLLYLNVMFLTLIGVLVIIFMILNLLWLVRRINDYNFSGYWIFLPILLALVPTIYASLNGPLAIEFMFIGIALSQITTLVLALIPGTSGYNRYGDVPPQNNFFNYTFFFAFILLTVLLTIADLVMSPENISEQPTSSPRIDDELGT